MIEQSISLDRLEETINIFGSFDENIRLIEHEMGVTVVSRDSALKVCGEDGEQVIYAVKAIESLMNLASRGETINEQNVRYIIQLVRAGKESQVHNLAADVICITAKGKPIKAKTLGQKKYVDAIKKNVITLGIGPAGTGKTYLAVAAAVAAFRAKEINRIILTRPAVEAGERLGFLPGDLQSKVDPYLRPLYERPYFGRLLHHSGRGPEHQPGADEDVPDPSGLWIQDRHHRRHYPDRPAGRQGLRPAGGYAGAEGCGRHRHYAPDRVRRGPPRPGAEDHQGL